MYKQNTKENMTQKTKKESIFYCKEEKEEKNERYKDGKNVSIDAGWL